MWLTVVGVQLKTISDAVSMQFNSSRDVVTEAANMEKEQLPLLQGRGGLERLQNNRKNCEHKNQPCLIK